MRRCFALVAALGFCTLASTAHSQTCYRRVRGPESRITDQSKDADVSGSAGGANYIYRPGPGEKPKTYALTWSAPPEQLCPGRPADLPIAGSGDYWNFYGWWWATTILTVVPEGGIEDEKVMWFLYGGGNFPKLPEGSGAPRRWQLDPARFSGDSLRLGVRAGDGGGQVFAVWWTFAKMIGPAPGPAPAAAPQSISASRPPAPLLGNPRPMDPDSAAQEVIARAAAERVTLTRVFLARARGTARLRVFLPGGIVTRGLGNAALIEANRLLDDATLSRADQERRVEALLAAAVNGDALVADWYRAWSITRSPLAPLEGAVGGGSYSHATATGWLRELAAEFEGSPPDAEAQARRRSTLFLLAHQKELTTSRAVSVAYELVGGSMAGQPAPPTPVAPTGAEERALATGGVIFDDASTAIGWMDKLGMPGAKDIATQLKELRLAKRIAVQPGSDTKAIMELFRRALSDAAAAAGPATAAQLKERLATFDEISKWYNRAQIVAREYQFSVANARYQAVYENYVRSRVEAIPVIQAEARAARAEAERLSRQQRAVADSIAAVPVDFQKKFGFAMGADAKCRDIDGCEAERNILRGRMDRLQDRSVRLTLERRPYLLETRVLCDRTVERGAPRDRDCGN